MDTTFEGVWISVLCAFFYLFYVDINSEPLIIQPIYFLDSIQYLCKYMVFPYTLIELHLYYLGVKEPGFGTLRKDCKGNNPFPLNPVMVMWRLFMGDDIVGSKWNE